ncbi:MAG: hypothetical protein Q7S74_01440 [Nanoarchaeota archaeon]|nr:hypothetical protein [Nanoarchaeota archaeon]
MINEVLGISNFSDTANQFATAANSILPPELSAKISTALDVLKIFLIAIVVYFIFIIIKRLIDTFTEVRNSRNIKVISDNVASINNKLDLLISHHKTKEDKEDKKLIRK